MKNLMITVALLGCIAACKADNKSVSSADSANMPKKECTGGTCTDASKAECTGQKASCCAEKAKPQG